MIRNYYIPGEFNVTCDRCSRKIKAHESKHEWTGFIVCTPCFEMRHPQDFVKARQDKITVPFIRPLETPTFTVVDYACTADGITAITGYATSGCSIAGNT